MVRYRQFLFVYHNGYRPHFFYTRCPHKFARNIFIVLKNLEELNYLNCVVNESTSSTIWLWQNKLQEAMNALSSMVLNNQISSYNYTSLSLSREILEKITRLTLNLKTIHLWKAHCCMTLLQHIQTHQDSSKLYYSNH